MNVNNSEFDFIVIGAGATGCGIVLDAASRGYKVLLLEKNDFGSGISSKSTKLVHGGVRYLEKAFLDFDKSQFKLVRESLIERKIFLNNASKISKSLKIITPLYSYFQMLYLQIGLKIYDKLSQKSSLGSSELLSKTVVDNLKDKNLLGVISYFDGSFNDSQMITSILMTAKNYDVVLKNYCEVKDFIYEDGKISAVKFLDKNQKRDYVVKAKVVINASGENIDEIRKLDDVNSLEQFSKSKGSHIVLPKKFLDSKDGVLIPKTEDKRVIFFHPWNDVLIVGTTEVDGSEESKISDDEIDYLLKYANKYLKKEVKKEDILSSFCGNRMLLKDEKKSNSNITRDHFIEVSESNLVSIGGGKWTTYRKMAEDCLERIFQTNLIEKKSPCKTANLKLEVLKPLEINEKDIVYAIEHYNVKRVLDMLLRVTNLAYTDINKAIESIDLTCEIIGNYFSWDSTKIIYEKEFSKNYLENRFK